MEHNETGEVSAKAHKFHHFPDSILTKPRLFSLPWKTTCLESPRNTWSLYTSFTVSNSLVLYPLISWSPARWRHEVETLSILLTLCEGNPPVTVGFPSHGASAGDGDGVSLVGANPSSAPILDYRYFGNKIPLKYFVLRKCIGNISYEMFCPVLSLLRYLPTLYDLTLISKWV